MDDDNKIEKKLDNKAEVRLFLKDELLPLEKATHVNSYDLLSEYAKTRKNKSYFVWILMAACFAAVILVTTLVVQRLKVQNKKIEVSSSVFNDLDMSAVLNNRSHIQLECIVAENNLSQMQKEFDYKMQQAADKRDADLQLVSAMRLENADSRKKQILAVYRQTGNSLHAEYDSKLSEISEKTAALKAQLAALDKKNGDDIDSANFADQVQQHERTLLINSFQSTIDSMNAGFDASRRTAFSNQQTAVKNLGNKYHEEVDALDPVLKDARADQIISSAPEAEPMALSKYETLLSQPVLTEDFVRGIKNVENLFGSYNYIHDAVEKIPQKHSIASYKDSEKRLVSGMLKEMGTAIYSEITSLNNSLMDLESQKANLLTQKAGLEKQNEDLHADLGKLQKDYGSLELQYNGVSGNISMFNSWFENSALEDESCGYVLDLSGSGKLKVFAVKSVRDNLLSDTASVGVDVYHGKRKRVSEGVVTQQDGIYYFTPSDPNTLSLIAAGDRLAIPVKK